MHGTTTITGLAMVAFTSLVAANPAPLLWEFTNVNAGDTFAVRTDHNITWINEKHRDITTYKICVSEGPGYIGWQCPLVVQDPIQHDGGANYSAIVNFKPMLQNNLYKIVQVEKNGGSGEPEDLLIMSDVIFISGPQTS